MEFQISSQQAYETLNQHTKNLLATDRNDKVGLSLEMHALDSSTSTRLLDIAST